MTGFARVRQTTEHGEIAVSLKSVNHRGLDLHFHLGAGAGPFEARHPRRGESARAARARGGARVPASPGATARSGSLNQPLLAVVSGGLSRSGRRARHRSAARSERGILRLPGMSGASGPATPDAGAETAVLAALRRSARRAQPVSRARGRGDRGEMREHNAAIVAGVAQKWSRSAPARFPPSRSA